MKKIALLCLLLIPLACSKKDGETSQAEQELKEEKKTCDGKGTELSGVYLVTGDATTGKCTDNDEEVPSPGTKFMVNCDQKDDSFKCKLVDRGDFSLDGCINEDGTFFTSSPTDLGFLGEGIVTVNAIKEEKVTKLDGKIEAEDGTGELTHSSVASRDQQKKGCNITWKVTLEKIGEDEQRDLNDDGDGDEVPPPDETAGDGLRPEDGARRPEVKFGTVFAALQAQSGHVKVGDPKKETCSTTLPILCIEETEGEIVHDTSSASEGNVQLSKPVQGITLTSLENANQICQEQFGDTWRIAKASENSDGENLGWWGKGTIPASTEKSKFWVHSLEQSNCW